MSRVYLNYFNAFFRGDLNVGMRAAGMATPIETGRFIRAASGRIGISNSSSFATHHRQQEILWQPIDRTVRLMERFVTMETDDVDTLALTHLSKNDQFQTRLGEAIYGRRELYGIGNLSRDVQMIDIVALGMVTAIAPRRAAERVNAGLYEYIKVSPDEHVKANYPYGLRSGCMGICLNVGIADPLTLSGYMFHRVAWHWDAVHLLHDGFIAVQHDYRDLFRLKVFCAGGGPNPFPDDDYIIMRTYVIDMLKQYFLTENIDWRWSSIPLQGMELFLNTGTGEFRVEVFDDES